MKVPSAVDLANLAKTAKFNRIHKEIQNILDRESLDIQAMLNITPLGIFPTFGLIERKEQKKE